MIRPLVDQKYVMLIAQLAAQMCGRNNAAAPAAKYDDLFFSVESKHSSTVLWHPPSFCGVTLF